MFVLVTKSLSLLCKSFNSTLKSSKNIRLSSHFTYKADETAPCDGPKKKMNMFQAINDALDITLKNDESALIFGEDVGFGGVFRCSVDLQVN